MAVVVFRDKRLDAFEAVRHKRRGKVVIIIQKLRVEKDLEAMEKDLRRNNAKGLPA